MNLTRAICTGQFKIDAFHTNTGDKAYYQGHYYSDKAPGLSFLAVPFYLLLKIGVHSEKWQRYGLTVAALGLPSALAALLFYYIMQILTGLKPHTCTALTLIYSLGTLAFPFSTIFYGHQLAAVAGLSSFYLLLNAKTGALHGKFIIIAGFCAGWAFISDYPAGIIMVALSLYAFFAIPQKQMIYWFAGLCLPLGLLAYYHFSCFGSILSNGYQYHVTFNHQSGFMGINLPELSALWGISFSPYRGLFYQAPVLLFIFPGVYFFGGQKKLRPEFYLCTAIVLGFLCFNSGYMYWDGIGSTGARFMIPALPFMVIILGFAFEKWGGLILSTGLVAIISMLIITATEPRAEQQVSNPLFYFNYFLLTKGYLCQNIGGFFNLKGFVSLVPLICFLIFCFGLTGFAQNHWALTKSIVIFIGILGWIFVSGWENKSLRKFYQGESLFRYYRCQNSIDWNELEKQYRMSAQANPQFAEVWLRLALINYIQGDEAAYRLYLSAWYDNHP